MSRILVVDDDAGMLAAFRDLLGGQRHEVLTAQCAETALQQVEAAPPELVVMDVWLPGMDGMEAFRRLRAGHPRLPVIVMTGGGTTELAIEAAKLGAFDYLLKPFEPEALLGVIGQALASRQPKRAGAAGEAVGRAPPEMIGQSAGMQQVYKAVGRVAATNATVLIRGESGTGKELVVQAIHQHSRRCRGPLVVVNCVAIPETLLESELFGYERGAFTGANTSRVGRFEQADGGTLLLDEIGDMPPGIQAKLLRVLQERTFERIGANERRWVDVRVLAATNRDLERGMAEGRFREDLYHRLNVVTIQLPALRERREDIPALVQHFLGRAARELGLEVPPLSKEAQRQLWEYDWPGNVRELDHCLQRILIWSRDRAIQGEDVRRALTPRPERPPDDEEELLRAVVQKFIARHAGAAAHERMLEWVDRLMVLEALRQTHGNQSRAARLLGLPRPTLHAHIDKYKAPAPS